MKVIVTTSDNYHHALPVFFKCWERHWGGPVELVGYKKPEDLPNYVTFVCLGHQRGPKFFSDDLAPYFAKQPQFFVWLMEDQWLKGFDRAQFELLVKSTTNAKRIGKICLTNESMRREHHREGQLFVVSQNAKYRLSTQPAIWNRDYLLQYMAPGLTPWDLESQPQQNDGWIVMGLAENVVEHNEGIRRHNIHELNLDGIEL